MPTPFLSYRPPEYQPNVRMYIRTLLVSFIAILAVTGLQNIDIPPQPRAVASQETKTVVEAVKQPVKKKVVKHATKKKKPLSKPQKQPVAVSRVAKPSVTAPSGSCRDWIRSAGIKDIDTAYILIMKESTCNPNAVNPSSGACGLGQQLPCGKWAHTWNEPVGALKDMNGYVMGRYGSWQNALNFHLANNWY